MEHSNSETKVNKKQENRRQYENLLNKCATISGQLDIISDILSHLKYDDLDKSQKRHTSWLAIFIALSTISLIALGEIGLWLAPISSNFTIQGHLAVQAAYFIPFIIILICSIEE